MSLFNEVEDISNDEKKEFAKFMNQLKDKVIQHTISDIGTEHDYDDEKVLSLFPLICNTPLIFDVFKIVIRNAYCGDSTQIEDLMDKLKMKSMKSAEENGFKW